MIIFAFTRFFFIYKIAAVTLEVMLEIPRNHYLLVHDALRKICAASVSVAVPTAAPSPPLPKLAAFVRQRHPFQCHMLVNSPLTDPDNFQPTLPFHHRHSSSSANFSNGSTRDRHGKGRLETYRSFLYALQRELGSCHVLPGPHIARVDIRFPDQSVIHLALGAALEDLSTVAFPASCSPAKSGYNMPWSSPELRSAAVAAVNEELSRSQRARLRVSLGGYDEALFIQSASGIEKLTAQKLCEWTYQYVARAPAVWLTHPVTSSPPKSSLSRDLLLPPYYYWLAHAREALTHNKASVKNQMDLMRIVQSQFVSVFDELPLENPFFPGENLNSLPEVQWWGMLFQPPAAASKLNRQTASLSFHAASSPPHYSTAVPQPVGVSNRAVDDGVVELNLSMKKEEKCPPSKNTVVKNE